MSIFSKKLVKIGSLGESIAVKHLKNKGFLIVDRNFTRHNIGEIDIIALKDGVFHFVEVKTSKDRDVSDNFHSIRHFDQRKKQKLKEMMHIYSKEKNITEVPRCLDLLAVSISPTLRGAKVYFSENIYFEEY
jgi:putative endonuclease